MKLQHLSVIFVIIIMPLSMVLSTYVNNLIDVSNTEAQFDTVLLNSAYDAVRAYQMNTVNNTFASVNTSRVRDINASVNSFFNSLATGFESSAYSKSVLTPYVPAILFTLYDGFYLYGAYDNYVDVNEGRLDFKTSNPHTEFGLKPYTYYTCEYTDNLNYHIIINYTLDNYISVAGWHKIGSEKKYITASGYYLNPNKINSINDSSKEVVLKDGTNGTDTITIKPEVLGEYVSYYNSKSSTEGGGKKTINTNIQFKYYNYINYKEDKYYFDPKPEKDDVTWGDIPIFRLDKNLKIYINKDMLETLAEYNGSEINIEENPELIDNNELYTKASNTKYNLGSKFYDTNNYHYYKEAKAFSENVFDILKKINITDPNNIIRTSSYNEVYNIETDDKNGSGTLKAHTKTDYETKNIFDYTKPGNDPELESSSFNQHRIDVIVSNIEYALSKQISNFNNYQSNTYDYRMPAVSEEDWDKIANNVTVMAFLQGMVVGNYKFYNNYTVVADTKNKEFISKDAIYAQDVISATTATTNYYKNNTAYFHLPGCTDYHIEANENPSKNIICYRLIDYDIDSYTHEYDEFDSEHGIWKDPKPYEIYNYYMQPGAGAYECIVTRNVKQWSYDELMTGVIDSSRDEGFATREGLTMNNKIRAAYISALAREKGATFKNLEILQKSPTVVNDSSLNP